MAGPGDFLVSVKTQNLHLLAELDFGIGKKEVWASWLPLPGQEYGLAFAGLEGDLPGIDPLDVFQVFIPGLAASGPFNDVTGTKMMESSAYKNMLFSHNIICEDAE